MDPRRKRWTDAALKIGGRFLYNHPMGNMKKPRLDRLFNPFVRGLEKFLAIAVLASVILAAIHGGVFLAGLDWTAKETFYELIYRMLLLVIGLELVRMLITHSLAAVLELLAFVIARKMLKPDLTSIDIILSVLAFVALLAGRKYLMSHTCYLPRELEGEADGDPLENKPGQAAAGSE
jgi:hypothetical protein